MNRDPAEGMPARPVPVIAVEARKMAPGLDPRGADQAFTYTVLPGTPLGKGERRGGSRQRTRLRSGKLMGPDGQFISECVILNRSPAGGRLRLPALVLPPPRFFFYDDQTEQLFTASLKWHKDRDLGIILSPCTLDAASRALAGRMRRKFYALRK